MKKHLDDYRPLLDVRATQAAIEFIKRDFVSRLATELNLTRVSAPLFVYGSSGLNDGLSGKEVPIRFHVNGIEEEVEIVHSLAKWKRFALGKYGFPLHTGIYTDMNAIRKDEDLDFMHSAYVDQWDWEVAISKEDRTFDFLRLVVDKIYQCIRDIEHTLHVRYQTLTPILPEKIVFISSSELEKRYPNLSRKQREDAITREYGAVFLTQIGGKLNDGKPHDSRAADYDDWSLNGDILLHYPLFDMAFEVSSMGIRVNKESLLLQLKEKGEESKKSNAYCQAIINDELPLSIGGGIGQSRLCMFLLRKAHIGEVQVSVWDEKEIKELEKENIRLL